MSAHATHRSLAHRGALRLALWFACGSPALAASLPAQARPADAWRSPTAPRLAPAARRAAVGDAGETGEAPALRRNAGGAWRRFALGAGTSLLAHELGHVAASTLVGARPSFGFNKGRPTVYSGIQPDVDRRDQLVFSSAGLAVQAVLDELLLDMPHERSGAFERGVLAGGIGTALFYVTAGRNGNVSDVSYIAEMSGHTKTQVSLVVGGIAALHAVRIHRLARYAHFFSLPSPGGGMRLGMSVETR